MKINKTCLYFKYAKQSSKCKDHIIDLLKPIVPHFPLQKLHNLVNSIQALLF